MKRMTMALVVGLSLGTSSAAWAQLGRSGSPYTQGVMNALTARSSATNFSADRIRGNLLNRAVPRFSVTSPNYRSELNSSLASGRSGKPFSGRTASNSVNPWMSMSDPFSNSGHNYYTQVRPQLEQQRAAQSARAQAMRQQQQLTSIAAQPPYDPSGSENMMPTGHSSVYMNYGGYYPPAQIQQKRR